MAVELGVLDDRRYVWDKGQIYWAVPDVREAVRAGTGRKLVIADYSQIEVRLMAFMSQEPALITALNAKKDIHCHMTSLVYGIDYGLLEAVVVNKDKKHPQYNELSKKRSGVKTVTFECQRRCRAIGSGKPGEFGGSPDRTIPSRACVQQEGVTTISKESREQRSRSPRRPMWGGDMV